jgi:hypothetical protein
MRASVLLPTSRFADNAENLAHLHRQVDATNGVEIDLLPVGEEVAEATLDRKTALDLLKIKQRHGRPR